MNDTPPPLQVTEARRSWYQRVSVIWIIPLIAIVISLGVAWQTYANRGPLITITFEDGAGIAKRETELRYRDVTVGVVEDVKFTPDLSAVEAMVRVDTTVAPYLDSSASFWIVQPELTAQGVTGLDTVLSGVYIEGTWDNEPGLPVYRFSGLPTAPLFRSDEGGLEIVLRTPPGGSMTDNSPITFRGIEVGRIGQARISADGNFALAEALIYEPHDRLISSATRFWDISGFSFSVGPSGAEIDFSSVATLLGGGVTFDTFVSGGDPINDGQVFEVHPGENEARNSLFTEAEVETLQVRVIFEQNVSGLTVDAPVEINGLNIGKVQSVLGTINREEFGDDRVRLNVLLAIQPARLGLPDEVTPEAAKNFLERRIQNGLRAQLANASLLTGGLKIVLVQVDDADPAEMEMSIGGLPILPTIESDVSDAAASIEGVLNRVNELPIEELLTSAIDFLNSAEALVGNEDLQQTPADIRALVGNINGVVGSDEAQTLLVTLNSAVTQFEQLLVDVETAELAARLADALDATSTAATTLTTQTNGLPDLIDQITALATKAEALPLEALTAEITDVATATATLLEGDGAQELPGILGGALGEVEAALRDLRAGGTVENLNAALVSTQEAAATVTASAEGLPALVEQLEAVATKARNLPLEDLTLELTELAEATTALVDSDAARALPADLSAALAEVNATLQELRQGGAVANLNATLGSARDAAGAVEQATADLPALAARMRAVLDQAGRTIAGYDQGQTLSRDVESTLRDIQNAANALESLARTIERNPSALIRGR
ncbi:MlaD family protein [Pseudooctadecabacter jejudonensis]|uniref:Paraquat-inducible protein B n=1 Tax=Pseudooctadecabacter jejudonensis TaxID=1391910 RepID=A0A1Y5RK32_9RHOB|nr:MlaD family protein [Pseudooctadecabacter jejudonensis]SLN18225.1 Paraquat-inducible protein B [Pseudooctadecabacter jejudonensis]